MSLRVALTNFLLAAISCHLASTHSDHDVARYCRLSLRHTMCKYPFDNASPKCIDLVSGDLDPEDVAAIVHEHNRHRSFIAEGLETRGKPGPQPPAKNMMEMTWDDELARIARRWVIQCIPGHDDCRDVDDFGVWQNVHVMKLEPLESGRSSLHRIPLHVQSWADDVENFDCAEVGMVDFGSNSERPYIGIAASMITRVGCGRAMYSVDAWQMRWSSSLDLETTQLQQQQRNRSKVPWRTEVLVCNYGPIDRTTPQIFYEHGMPGNCPAGFAASRRYEYLCRERDEDDDETWNEVEFRRSSSGMTRYCAWTSFLTALSQYLLNALLSTG